MRSAFAGALAELQRGRSAQGRRWIFVPYDQLTCAIGPLAGTPAGQCAIALVETPAKAARRAYHKQKLALVLANLRHFALEQARRGVYVRHLVSKDGYAAPLAALVAEVGPLELMRPAERELREELRPLVDSGALRELPHQGWLTDRALFLQSQRGARYRMDAFYRLARKQTGLLMRGGAFEGGKLSFDADNRKKWRGDPQPPDALRFPRDAIKDEVCALISERFAGHPGRLDADALPATAADAEALWARALGELLPHFGPYEDAMSLASTGLFHSRVSALLNLHRLLPARLVSEAAASAAPLQSREGFVRQILGWREFVHHVHEATDGFRALPDLPQRPKPVAATPLPPAYWGKESGLRCLDAVVESVWSEGYSHHITRLMVLCNIAQLLELDARELTDWFWIAYIDAYDWVVEPNVLGMGTYSAGDLMTTKPYLSGAGYIDKMSDYCGDCRFDPRSDCPLTPMYWAYLNRRAEQLHANPRMVLPVRAATRRPLLQRQADQAVFERVQRALLAGELLKPE